MSTSRGGNWRRGGGSGEEDTWRRAPRDRHPGPNERPTPKREICRFFQHDRCRFEASCRYLHERPTETEDTCPARQKNSAQQEESPARQEYLDFKRRIRELAQFPFIASEDRLLGVWKQALAVLSREEQVREWPLSLAADLADDDIGGPSVIKKTIQACMKEPAGETSLDISTNFLHVITHHLILDCLSIESFVGAIYRLVGGVRGDQGIAFLSSLVKISTSKPSSEAVQPNLSLVVSALHQLLCRERKCLLNEALGQLFTSIEDALRRFSETSVEVQVASTRMGIMKRMCDAESHRLVVLGNADVGLGSHGNVHTTFPVDAQVPSGNHDNDLPDITKIQIFPTPGEVMDTAAEFLPTTDLRQPHFLQDPVRRHLDTAFRLLRHDIFSPLKDIVGLLLAQGEQLQTNHPSPPIMGNTRANSYGKAVIKHVFVDTRTGLEAILQFAMPPQIRKLSLDKQRAWWHESSRLDEGRLVCFVSTVNGQASFIPLVVTSKSTERGMNYRLNKSTLVSEDMSPTITVRLASETCAHLCNLNNTYTRRSQGVMIELPGLIPDTFVPTLESLQRMMRDGNLAFHDWILPCSGSTSDQPIYHLPPPIYSRRDGFKFSLKSINVHDKRTVQTSERYTSWHN
ncbi:hypothetical protein QBC35DRAFT_441301, partial [Podospora australis]